MYSVVQKKHKMKFGIANNVRSEVRVCTPDLFNQALDSPHVAKTCAEIEDALEACQRGEMNQGEYETLKGQLKKRLPIFTFHATFPSGKRKNDDAVPSGLSIYDLDHIPNPRAKWEEIEPRTKELGILLAHVSPSLEGLRLVFLIPRGKDLAGAQAWMAGQLGDEKYDSCVKDHARCSFAVPREYVLYLDVDALFADDNLRHGFHGLHGTHPLPNEANAHLDDAESCDKSVSSNQPEATETEGNEKPWSSLSEAKNPCNPCQENEDTHYPETYEGIPYAEIVTTLEEQMGGQPEHGSRNNFIFSMACHLRYVCDDDASWIARILPTYGESREKWMATIRSACARNQTKLMPRIMRRTIAICKRHREESEIINQKSEINTPPQMPEKLPPLIELLLSRTPDIYKPAVAHAVFPALGAHLWRTTFRYIDNVAHEATLMNVLMAGTGAGKNCITEPVNRILADIRKRDRENMYREKAWKKEMQATGANKNKRQRPEGLVIQEIDPDMTNAAFVQRLADAEGRFLYTKMNEIDQFDALKTSANRKAQFQIMCLAFDPGNVYGQTRIGTSSVTERVCIRFNWNASTTIQKGQAYFRGVLTDGPISRINFCTIPEREIGSPMPVYGSYDDAFDRELATYIGHLNAVRGEVECPEAMDLARTLSEECAKFARLSQSRVYENLSFRANVIAYLKAMVLYVAHGEQWSREMEDFVRWSLQYDLWCKMEFFGQAIEEVEDGIQSVHPRKGPQNLLDLLPEVFTREEAGLMRQHQGIRQGTLKSMLSNWKKRGYIELYGEEMYGKDIARQRYVKTEAYLKDHPQKEGKVWG